MLAPWSWGVLAALPVLAAASEPVGCFLYGMRFTPAVSSPQIRSSAEACQELCGNTRMCARFGYFPASQECFVGSGDSDAVIDISAVGGPPTCEAYPQYCDATPTADFPTADPTKPTATAWSSPSGPVLFPPAPLMCWPRNEYRELSYCYADPLVLLESNTHHTGWAGECLGLTQKTLGANETCKANCERNVLCPGYALVSDGTCWQGVGDKCFSDQHTTQVAESARYMHGHYRVLADLAGWYVQGLVSQDVEPGLTAANFSEKIRRCRNTCLSVIDCEVWTYSNATGCWYNNNANTHMSRPSTANWKKPPASNGAAAGEYIQRLCGNLPYDQQPLLVGSSTTTTTVPPEQRLCSANPACAANGLTGDCCPSSAGDFLMCCFAVNPGPGTTTAATTAATTTTTTTTTSSSSGSSTTTTTTSSISSSSSTTTTTTTSSSSSSSSTTTTTTSSISSSSSTTTTTIIIVTATTTTTTTTTTTFHAAATTATTTTTITAAPPITTASTAGTATGATATGGASSPTNPPTTTSTTRSPVTTTTTEAASSGIPWWLWPLLIILALLVCCAAAVGAFLMGGASEYDDVEEGEDYPEDYPLNE